MFRPSLFEWVLAGMTWWPKDPCPMQGAMVGEACGSQCQRPGAGERLDSGLAFRSYATGPGVWALWWHHLLPNLVVVEFIQTPGDGEPSRAQEFSRSPGQPNVSPRDQSGSRAALFLLQHQLRCQGLRLPGCTLRGSSRETREWSQSLLRRPSGGGRVRSACHPGKGAKEEDGKKKSQKPSSPV